MVEVKGSKRVIKTELALLSMGFVHCIHEGLADELGVKYDKRGNIVIDEKQATTKAKVYACGDAAAGASLVVRAITSGRKTAENIHAELIKK
jgi:glutamate synthase (NADPH/NADH) small chain